MSAAAAAAVQRPTTIGPFGGRPALGTAGFSLSDATCARVVAEATRWSCALLGEHLRSQDLKISDSTVARILRDADLQPHRQKMWLTSHDDEYRACAPRTC